MSDQASEAARDTAIITAIGQLVPILNVHTELLQHIIQLAQPGPNDGGGLVDILLRIERMLTTQGALLQRLVALREVPPT